MGQRHLSSVYKLLSSEVKGKFSLVRELRYEEDKKNDQRYTLVNRKTQKESSSLTFRSLPGCCGVALLHSFKGDRKDVVEFINYVLKAVKRAKYGQVLLTLRSDSRIIESLPTHEGFEFLNGKTGNKVVTILINLEAEPARVQDTASE